MPQMIIKHAAIIAKSNIQHSKDMSDVHVGGHLDKERRNNSEAAANRIKKVIYEQIEFNSSKAAVS